MDGDRAIERLELASTTGSTRRVAGGRDDAPFDAAGGGAIGTAGGLGGGACLATTWAVGTLSARIRLVAMAARTPLRA